jgi:quercetin dioxygenase-like cupin family protein
MPFVELDSIEVKEPFPGIKGRFVHTDNMTMAYWDIDEGALLPEHAHVAEQVVSMVEGKLELTVEGETRVLESGTILVIPSNVPHSARAITKVKVIDTFYPIREEYR